MGVLKKVGLHFKIKKLIRHSQTMKASQILGILRHVLGFGGGILVSKGVLDESSVNEVVGAILAIAAVAASYFSADKKG